MKKKNLAILIPVYNNQLGLEKTLKSIKEEGGLFDIIIVDDGSKKAIDIGGFCDMNIHVISLEKNQGIVKALNAGLEHIITRGYKYIARIDAGDVCKEMRFKKQLEYLESNFSCGMVGCWSEAIDIDNKIIYTLKPEKGSSKKFMRYTTCCPHSAVMIRSDILKKVGYYKDDFIDAEDYELFFRIMMASEIVNLQEVLMQFEIGRPCSISVTKRRSQLKTKLKVQCHYFDYKNIHSYLGIFRTIAIFITPTKFIFFIKKLLKSIS